MSVYCVTLSYRLYLSHTVRMRWNKCVLEYFVCWNALVFLFLNYWKSQQPFFKKKPLCFCSINQILKPFNLSLLVSSLFSLFLSFLLFFVSFLSLSYPLSLPIYFSLFLFISLFLALSLSQICLSLSHFFPPSLSLFIFLSLFFPTLSQRKYTPKV